MPKFVTMPHGFSFDIEQVVYFQISYGDTWWQEFNKRDKLASENRSFAFSGGSHSDPWEDWDTCQPMKLRLHFKSGHELKIPDFEALFLDTSFFPAIRELEASDVPRGQIDQLGSVYLIQGELSQLIKIGFTIDVKKRLRALEQSEPLALLKEIKDVPRSYEKELHQRFSELRERGEWFRPGALLLEFINQD